ncbi:MAG: hypothetical protein WD972_01025, partial [Candidatus Andersenbacteria bacterium]
LHIRELKERLGRKNIKLEVSKGVKEEIATKAFAVGKGARPIRQIVQEVLEDPIANSVISEEVLEGHSLLARKTGGKVSISPSKKAAPAPAQ